MSWFYSPVIFNFRQPIIHRADSDVWAQKYIPGGQALVDDLPGVKVSHSVGRLSDELDFWDQRSFLTLYVDMFVHGYTPLTTETTSESNFVVASQCQNNSINVYIASIYIFLNLIWIRDELWSKLLFYILLQLISKNPYLTILFIISKRFLFFISMTPVDTLK